MTSALQQVTDAPASWNRTSASGTTKNSSSLALMSTDQLTPEATALVLQTAKDIRATLTSDDAEAKAALAKCLHHRILSVISYTAAPESDATHLRAFTALGGSTLYVDASSKGGMTSAKKGETLADTLSCMECYGDLAVLRHWDDKAVEEAVRRSRKGLIVGNGDGEGDITDFLGDQLFGEVAGDAGSALAVAVADPEAGSEQQTCREFVRMAIYRLMLE